MFCTKATHADTRDELYKYIDKELLYYSKKSQCTDDFIVVKEFKELYQKNEKNVKYSLKETKHLLDHFGEVLKTASTIEDAEKIKKELSLLPTKDYLEQSIKKAIERFTIF